LDAAGFGEEAVPGVATGVDNLGGVVEDAVGELVILEVEPEPLDRVELGRIGRQEYWGDVGRHDQFTGDMPACPVHQHDGVCAGSDGLGQFGEEEVHRGGVEPGHHQRHTGVARGTYRADDPGRAVPEVAPPARGMAALPPDVAGAAGLPDPSLVLAPDLKALGFGMGLYDLVQVRGKPPFLKASCAFGSVCG
jgi:hypothetical protein